MSALVTSRQGVTQALTSVGGDVSDPPGASKTSGESPDMQRLGPAEDPDFRSITQSVVRARLGWPQVVAETM